ncbi:hypothetical protein STEG23_037450, partial [Scotinomys teguina]
VGPFHGVPDFLDILFYDLFGFGVFLDCLIYFLYSEACVPFFEAYTTVVLGNKKIMNELITKFEPTDQERQALEKIQECYNEAGLLTKLTDGLVLGIVMAAALQGKIVNGVLYQQRNYGSRMKMKLDGCLECLVQCMEQRYVSSDDIIAADALPEKLK